MSDTAAAGLARATTSAGAADLYRAVWRWHFYAGLLVLPFLLSLAVTGALYLFRDEIEAVVHADLKRVELREGAVPMEASALVSAALAAHPGTAVKYTPGADPGASAEVTVAPEAGGGKLAVYVDPYRAAVLGSLPDQGTIMWTVRQLHSLKFFGPLARAAIEIAAGWSVLLVATGLFLWWPRKAGRGGVVTVRGTPRQRIFWRDLHAVLGIFVGAVIVFLAVTGMPWSGVWGGQINEWANGSNFGYPAGVYTDVPMSDARLADAGPTSWSLEQAQMPMSMPAGQEGHGGHEGHGPSVEAQPTESWPTGKPPIGIDRAVEIVGRLGVHAGYALALPADPTGVYTASVYPDDVSQQRVVHLDQYTGSPLVDMSYGDYGPLGRALEWGISVHLGQEFGRPNQFALLAACLGIVALCVSAAVMWWKRRPSGSLGVPPMPADPRVFRGLLALLALGGLVFPLVGASLLAMLAIDVGVRRLGGGRAPRAA